MTWRRHRSATAQACVGPSPCRRERLDESIAGGVGHEAGPTEHLTRGQRAAYAVTAAIGSWRFLIIQTTFLAAWLVLNVAAWTRHWDPYPFILLNLLLSFQAAYAAPVMLMSGNRQSEVDRRRAAQDYLVNQRSEADVEELLQLARAQIAQGREVLDRLARLERDAAGPTTAERVKPG